MEIRKYNRDDKKLKDVIDGQTIHFGQAGASDYTTHKEPYRKERYIDRHQKNDYWGKLELIPLAFTANMSLGTNPL